MGILLRKDNNLNRASKVTGRPTYQVVVLPGYCSAFLSLRMTGFYFPLITQKKADECYITFYRSLNLPHATRIAMIAIEILIATF
jgi:hypothetical protein